MINEEGLRDWFGKSKSKDGKKWLGQCCDRWNLCK